MIIAVICIIVVLLIIILWAVFTNNSLIAKKNRVKQCRSGICVVLKQRNNLIPNLVASVKAYMGHENEILTRIADLRSRASNATESEQIKSGTEMSSLLSRLNVAVEDYPELKANADFMQLQKELADTENKIALARQFYNDTVLKYNNAIQMFPASLIAGVCGFRSMPFWNAEDAERENISVKAEEMKFQ